MYDEREHYGDRETSCPMASAVRFGAEPVRRRRSVIQPTRPEPGARGRVLVIDDDARISLSLQLILSEWHEVDALTSPHEALLRMRRGERYDVVLCDVMMPEMSAMELHATLERDLPGIASRIVFLTGGAFTPRASEFLSRVANPRFEKPLDIDRLIALVRRRVARQQLVADQL